MGRTHWSKISITSEYGSSRADYPQAESNALTQHRHVFNEDKMEWVPRLVNADGNLEL